IPNSSLVDKPASGSWVQNHQVIVGHRPVAVRRSTFQHELQRPERGFCATRRLPKGAHIAHIAKSSELVLRLKGYLVNWHRVDIGLTMEQLIEESCEDSRR